MGHERHATGTETVTYVFQGFFSFYLHNGHQRIVCLLQVLLLLSNQLSSFDTARVTSRPEDAQGDFRSGGESCESGSDRRIN